MEVCKTLRVIDAHMHTFPDAIAPRAIGTLAATAGIPPATDGTVRDTLRKMQQCGIDGAVFLNIATTPHQQHTINDCAARISRESGGKILALGSVHPDAPDAIEELSRIVSLGVRGIKLHPDYQGFFIDDERVYPIYEACEKLGLPIVFHAGWDCYSPDVMHASPERSARMLRDFPGLKVMLAHFGGLRRWEEVEQHLIGKNVWLDTSMCATFADPAMISRMIAAHGVERVVFGSDCPWEDPAKSLAFVRALKIPKTWKTAILSQNVQAFYGFDFACGTVDSAL